MSQDPCQHVEDIGEITLNDAAVCVECVKSGSRWVHLRTCQTCGRTHCCDSSPNKHATAHWQSTGHPVMASAEPGERWLWCYPHAHSVQY